MSDPLWYQNGLRFKCTQCGDCCSGDPGVVWVDQEELASIAEFAGLTETELRLRHTHTVEKRISLSERPNGDCSFLDKESRRCTIYSVRPKQCRTWPFWNSNLETPEAWEETRRACPGIGKGSFVPLEEIQRQAAIIDI
jgi:Fe-S-cluster containining protein